MAASLIVVALGAVAAAVGTGGLTARCSRAPSTFLVAWTAALLFLAVALAAQALGYLAGFSDIVFRCAEIAAQALAPLALCLGLVELIGQSVVARFSMRLAVAAIGVVVLAIMGSDPLSPNVTLGTGWPDPAVVYQLVPVGLIDFLAVFAIMTALVAAIVLMARSGRGQAFADLVRPGLIAAAAAVAVALPGLAMLAGSSLGAAGSAVAVVLSAGLTWFAANAAARIGLAGGSAAGERDRRRGRDAGRYGPYQRRSDRFDAQEEGQRHPAAGFEDDAGYGASARTGQSPRGRDSDIGYPALAALAAERSEPAGDHGAGDYGIGGYGAGDYDGRYDSGQVDAGGYPAAGPGPRRGHEADGSDLQAGLFGQITIYTLLEERIDEFDRMTEQVVEQVRAREPGTLVYIVHAVPTAPMQRILYEVYRDRPAYDEHFAQPYMTRYTAERRSMVLATNAIELGLQQAKVSPLPSYSAISDILSESGIDLTGVTRSPGSARASAGDRHGRPGQGPRELPAPGTGRYSRRGPDHGPDYEGPGYDGPDDEAPEYDGPGYRGPEYDRPEYHGPERDGWSRVRGEDGYR